MKQILATDIELIRDDILQSDIVLIGELHGVKQNIQITKTICQLIVQNKKSVIVAFEWPLSIDEVDMINDYIVSRRHELPQSSFFLDSDERFSIEHVQLLKHIRENFDPNTVSIQCFDSFNFSENYEQEMADKLLAINRNENTIIVAETGTIHARKRKSGTEIGSQIPMGFFISEKCKTFSIFLRYISGFVIVEGEMCSVTDAGSQIEGPKGMFDVELVINNAEPATSLDKLTEIESLLKS
jgi:hypothetical protein